MLQLKNLLISTFAAAVLLLFGGINEVNADPLTYKVVGGTVSIVSCDKNASGELVIPSTYDGKPVTSIGVGAFNGCSSLTSVTIPDSVTSIGWGAFQSCRSLTSVTIPDSITSIGNSAFYECSSLTSVTIPGSVTSIGAAAFYLCTSLKSVTIGGTVTSIGEMAFFGCRSLTSITFEDIALITFGVNSFTGVSVNAKIFVNPGATGFGERFAGLPVVIKAKTTIYLDGEYSNGKDVKKTESAVVSLFTHFPQGEIFYTLDGTKPTFTSNAYQESFVLTESATIRAIAYSADFTNSIEAEPVRLRLLPAYLLNVSTVGGGTAIIDPPDGPYLEGTELTVTAKPEGDWEFIGWEGDSTSSEATITITMDEVKALTATFGTNVTVNEIGEGKVVQTPSNPVPYGSTVTFTAKPDIGHYLFRWAGEQTGNDNPTQLQITKPNPVVSGLFAPSPVPDKIQINAVSKTDSPFTISFESKSGLTYVIEVSHNLKQWGELGEVQGTGSSVKFTDPRLPIVPFERNYFRVKLVE